MTDSPRFLGKVQSLKKNRARIWDKFQSLVCLEIKYALTPPLSQIARGAVEELLRAAKNHHLITMRM